MQAIMLVALGGALGSVARYGAGLWAARLFGLEFPWGTLAVNAAGGLAMGLLSARVGPAEEHLRLLFGVGVLGGFTTFSSFSIETVRLVEAHQGGVALAYVVASLGLSIAACWAGYALARA